MAEKVSVQINLKTLEWWVLWVVVIDCCPCTVIFGLFSLLSALRSLIPTKGLPSVPSLSFPHVQPILSLAGFEPWGAHMSAHLGMWTPQVACMPQGVPAARLGKRVLGPRPLLGDCPRCVSESAFTSAASLQPPW